MCQHLKIKFGYKSLFSRHSSASRLYSPSRTYISSGAFRQRLVEERDSTNQDRIRHLAGHLRQLLKDCVRIFLPLACRLVRKKKRNENERNSVHNILLKFGWMLIRLRRHKRRILPQAGFTGHESMDEINYVAAKGHLYLLIIFLVFVDVNRKQNKFPQTQIKSGAHLSLKGPSSPNHPGAIKYSSTT